MTNDPLAVEISVDSTFHMLKAVTAAGDGIQSFAGLGTMTECLTCLTVKNTGELCITGPHEQDVLPIFTRFGRRSLSANQYMDYVDQYCPDIFHALCDGDTNADSSKKRALKSADRTEAFFEKCLERFKGSERLKNSIFIGMKIDSYCYYEHLKIACLFHSSHRRRLQYQISRTHDCKYATAGS